MQDEATPELAVAREVCVAGLIGGHSGIEIGETRANAIKLLGEALRECRSAIEFRLVSMDGGTAHNAIPRDACATLALTRAAAEELAQAVSLITSKLCAQWCQHETNLELVVRDTAAPTRSFTLDATDQLLELLEKLPHGVLRMSEVFPGKVETSTNLAQIDSGDDEIIISTSSRSFRAGELMRAQNDIRALGESCGAKIEDDDGYPGWEPNPTSPLLQTTKQMYEQVYNRAPQVEVVHAGLECGVLAARLPGLDAVSFGPLIRGAHTPEEYVEIASVEPVWKMLTQLLEKLSR